MRLRKAFFSTGLAAALACASAGPADAQSLPRMAWNDVRNGVKDIGYIWAAPFHTDARDLLGVAAILGATGIALVYDDEIQSWIGNNPGSTPVKALRPFRAPRGLAELGDIWAFIRASGVLWTVGLLARSTDLRDAAMGCAAAGVAETFPRRLVLYNVVARSRPLITDDPYEFDVPGTKDWYRRSFFGGHAENAITCIAFWNTRFKLGVLEPLLYAAAIGVGVGRVADEAHWTSDTVLGLALGYVIGRNVALRQKARHRPRDATGLRASDFVVRLGASGPSIQWKFRF